MVSSFVDEIDKSGTAVPSLSAPTGEKELVVAAKNGNEESFEIFVERYPTQDVRRRLAAHTRSGGR